MGLIIYCVAVIFAGAILILVLRGKQNKKFEENLKQKGFNVTKKLVYGDGVLLIDENNKQWAIKSSYALNNRIYNYNDLVDVEVYEDGTNIAKTSSVGKVITGGILFGVVGALIGGSMGHKAKNECTSLKLHIVVNDVKIPFICVNFIKTKTKRSSITYKMAVQQANNMASALSVLQFQNKSLDESKQIEPSGQSDVTDQIKKLSELKDQGILTDEEFNDKKKILLDRI